jgi:hypothetical protein
VFRIVHGTTGEPLFETYYAQCAAVKTMSGAMRLPPQTWLYLLLRSATKYGNLSEEPTISPLIILPVAFISVRIVVVSSVLLPRNLLDIIIESSRLDAKGTETNATEM